MDEFFNEMQRLRDAVLDKGIADDWNILTSSMDALEDTHYAVAAFVASASNPTFPERELGERYLRMYGVMQAFAIRKIQSPISMLPSGCRAQTCRHCFTFAIFAWRWRAILLCRTSQRAFHGGRTSLLRSLSMTMVPT